MCRWTGSVSEYAERGKRDAEPLTRLGVGDEQQLERSRRKVAR